ncbi:hypothetical protein ACTXG6_14640 [Pseudonocardia sp. Cha107L01]|uniref:hypothetical protein n=1 Tax=Pseudonocardia sp. Cha107L01 TaxID=3457576 RepID=UPI00403E39D9
MTALLAVFVLLYSGLLGYWALVGAVRGRGLGLGYLGGLVLLELTLLVRAGLELARLMAASGGFGRGYAEPGVHAGYLLASIVVLPLVLTVTRATEQAAPTTELDPAASQVRDSRSGSHSAAEPPPAPASELDLEPGIGRRARRHEATWDALVAVVGCIAVAVVTLRMGSTGRPA